MPIETNPNKAHCTGTLSLLNLSSNVATLSTSSAITFRSSLYPAGRSARSVVGAKRSFRYPASPLRYDATPSSSRIQPTTVLAISNPPECSIMRLSQVQSGKRWGGFGEVAPLNLPLSRSEFSEALCRDAARQFVGRPILQNWVSVLLEGSRCGLGANARRQSDEME